MITSRSWLGIAVVNSCIWSDTPQPRKLARQAHHILRELGEEAFTAA